MKLGPVSTSTFYGAARPDVQRMQAELARLQRELSTGRVHDIGEALGARTRMATALPVERARLQIISDANALAANRMAASMNALDRIAETMQNFLGNLVRSQRGAVGADTLAEGARRDLATVTAMLNANAGGEFLFAGVNTDVRPIGDYESTPPGAAKLAVDAAFVVTFGFAQTDPAAAAIAPAAMGAFLDTAFAGLFDAPAWSSNWSSASSVNVRSRISLGERIETSVNANEAAFRGVASALVMVGDLGFEGLNDGGRAAVVDKAVEVLGVAMSGLTRLRASLGGAQEQTRRATEKLALQIDTVSKLEVDLVGVDPYGTATRLNELTTRLDASYAVSARLNGLSLLRYL